MDSTAMVKRGDYLVNSVCHCMHCHGDRDFTKFGAPPVPGTAGKGGNEIEKGLFARNLTPYALGNWTDKEIYKVLTTGIRKNGDTLSPLMPFWNYGRMPDQELYCIIAYLRTLPPIKNEVPDHEISEMDKSFYTAFYNNVFLKKYAKQKFSLPPVDDKIKRGEYLVAAGECNGCHTPFNIEALDYYEDSALAGGTQFDLKKLGVKVNTANLTPDSATGLGRWTEEVFVNKFKSFRDSATYNINPGKYNTIMPWAFIAGQTDEDLHALYAYLRSIKPITNRVQKWPQ
jgi:mono/diheme cytochrome c family protein